jgi:uncharacterized protein
MQTNRISHKRKSASRLRAAAARAVAIGMWVVVAATSASAGADDEFRTGERAFKTGDLVAATTSLRRAAEAGHTKAQVLLGDILDASEFDAEALAWYRRAAQQGDADGEFGVGSMYLAGEGVKQDHEQAYAWIQRAAEKKHTRATVAMASAYIRAEKGEIQVFPDKARAAEWLEKAAAFDYLPAVEALALAYRSGGYGLAPSPSLAARYTTQADAIRRLMSPDKGKKEKGKKK